MGQEVDVSASCLSSTSFNLNWTDNATNEVGIVLYRSVNGGAYVFDRQLPADTETTTITGLTPSTNYSYQVYAVTEGKLSTLAPTGTVSFTTLPATANVVYSITDGNWNNLFTWITSLLPIFSNDVIIGCIDPDIVTVNTPLITNICRTLTVETGSQLNFNVGETLRVQGDVTNKGTIDVNGGTLIIEGNLINTTSSTVSIGNGTLIVEGSFQNAATATLNGNTGLFRLAGNFTNQGAYNPNTSTMRFDGTTQQLINHTGTSNYNSSSTVTFNTNEILPLDIPPIGTGGGANNLNGGNGVTLAGLNTYISDHVRIVTFNVPAGTYTGINNLLVDINHTWNSDIEMYLVTPNNTVYSVAADMGGNGDGYDNVTFTMNNPPATTTAPTGNTTITGSFFPIENWNGYAGTYVGTWSLYIIDDAGGDFGTLNTTSLTLNQVSTPPPTGLQFFDVEMQNTGIEVRTQNTDIIVNNSATWTTGIFRADNNHLLIFPDNTTSTVAINASHADMSVRKIGNDAFDFPIGNAGWGAPIGISAPSDVVDHFTAYYVKQVTPYDPFSKEATIHHVGQCEYWILDRAIGSSSNVVVTLSYDDIRSCTVGPTGLKVVRWDGAIWRDHFNGGIINTPYDGVLSLGTVNNFSPFTLGALTDENILPLTFLSFDAKPLESDAILDWTTTGELNHDYFEIERSINGEYFKEIGNVKDAISRDNTKSTYSFIDKNVGIENREAYYRLKQIDTDGTFAYSDIKKVNWSINNSESEPIFVAYPNPFTDILTLEFDLEKQKNIEITLMDMAGRTIKTISQSFSKGSNKLELNNLQNLAQGSYLIQLKTNLTHKTFQVVKM
ncbi:T9SS type A sorting domain-containing protein [Bernardetia sp. OM2101]|uniref:T9SS type A sorting domain-containing protein n=1 Tax=Bernardetia sp. OM2101 TaxID=3344876 RepID=UPI0035CF6D6D